MPSMYPETANYWSGRVSPGQPKDTKSLFDKYATPLHDMLYDNNIVGRARPEESSYWSGTVSPEQQRPTKPQSMENLRALAEQLPGIGTGMAVDRAMDDPSLPNIADAALSVNPIADKLFGGLMGIGGMLLPSSVARWRDLDTLSDAEDRRLVLKGKNRNIDQADMDEDIWDRFGWWLNPPGNAEPKFETQGDISLNTSNVIDILKNKIRRPDRLGRPKLDEAHMYADELLMGEEAFNYIPNLRNYRVRLERAGDASLMPKKKLIHLPLTLTDIYWENRGWLDQPKSSLVHELSHGVAEELGLPRGGNSFTDPNYYSSMGEAAARNDGYRGLKSKSWRAGVPPSFTQDIPPNLQVVNPGQSPPSFSAYQSLKNKDMGPGEPASKRMQTLYDRFGPPGGTNLKNLEDIVKYLDQNPMW